MSIAPSSLLESGTVALQTLVSNWVLRATSSELSCSAGFRLPLGSVGLAPELHCSYIRPGQVLRIFDRDHHIEVFGAGPGKAAEVFGDYGLFTVRNAVLSEISGPHTGRNDFQHTG